MFSIFLKKNWEIMIWTLKPSDLWKVFLESHRRIVIIYLVQLLRTHFALVINFDIIWKYQITNYKLILCNSQSFKQWLEKILFLRSSNHSSYYFFSCVSDC